MSLVLTAVNENGVDSRFRGNDQWGVMPPLGEVTPAKAGVHCLVLTSVFSTDVVVIFRGAKGRKSRPVSSTSTQDSQGVLWTKSSDEFRISSFDFRLLCKREHAS